MSYKAPSLQDITIIADDLTGCLDAAAPFASEGVDVVAKVTDQQLDSLSASVLAVNTNSRSDSPVDAAKKISSLCRALQDLGRRRLFKKIDSTGKGNPTAEIVSLLQATSAMVAIVCPAFPAQGRTFVNGVIYVRGEPVNTLSPDDVVGTALPVKIMSIDRLDGLKHLANTACDAAVETKQIWLVDGSSIEDLDRIAEIVEQFGELAIGAGSSGIARALARRRCASVSHRQQQDFEQRQGPFVALIGSSNVVTDRQIRNLQSVFGGQCEFLDEIPGDAQSFDSQVPNILINRWHENRLEAVRIMLQRLAKTAPGTLVISGGDTAQFLLGAAKTSAVRIVGEIQPGIPWGIILDGELRNFRLVTKAGGFGTPDTLAAIFAHLQPSAEPQANCN